MSASYGLIRKTKGVKCEHDQGEKKQIDQTTLGNNGKPARCCVIETCECLGVDYCN